MAQLTFNVPDAIIPELVAALSAQFARVGGENDATFVRRVTRDHFWKVYLEQYRHRVAQATVVPVAEGDLGT
jgi:hypothetical protein